MRQPTTPARDLELVRRDLVTFSGKWRTAVAAEDREAESVAMARLDRLLEAYAVIRAAKAAGK